MLMKRVNLKTGASRKQSTPDFSESLMCFVFLKYPLWDSPFWLITDDLSQDCIENQVEHIYDKYI